MSKDGENLKMRSKKLLPGSGLTMLNHLFLLIYVALSIYPIIWMMFYSFKNNEEIFVTNPFGFPRFPDRELHPSLDRIRHRYLFPEQSRRRIWHCPFDDHCGSHVCLCHCPL